MFELFDPRSFFDDPWELLSGEEPSAQRYPLTNIGKNKQDQIVIEIALAGWKKDDISIKAEKNKIIIEGTREEKKEDKDDVKYVQQVISAQNFVRTIYIHEDYVGGDIHADMEDGILRIYVSRAKPTNSKTILIEQK